MKIASGYTLVTIAGENVVVPLGDKNVGLKSLVSLNDTGAFLWRMLERETTRDELLAAMLDEYETDAAQARADIETFAAKLQALNILE